MNAIVELKEVKADCCERAFVANESDGIHSNYIRIYSDGALSVSRTWVDHNGNVFGGRYPQSLF